MLKSFLKQMMAAVILLLFASSALADEWVVSGFATQGITYSSHYDYFGDSDDGISTDFTEIGINLSNNLTDQIRFTTQGAYRNSNTVDSADFFLDILQFDLQLPTNQNTTAGIKLGRLKLNYGLYSGTIDVPAVWPTALISDIAFYSVFRSSLISIDGLEINWQREINHWSLALAAQTGEEVLDERIFTAFKSSKETQADYKHVDDYYTLRVNIFSPDNSLLIGWDYYHANENFNLEVPGQLINKIEQTYKEQRLYIQKRWSNWQLDSEYIRGTLDSNVYDVSFPSGIAGCKEVCQNNLDLSFSPNDSSVDYDAAYINLYRHFSNGLTLYGGYGAQYDDDTDKNGKIYELETGFAANIVFMKQSLLGFKYDINHHWNIAAMYSYFSGTANLESFSNPADQRKHKYWQVIHMNVSYVF